MTPSSPRSGSVRLVGSAMGLVAVSLVAAGCGGAASTSGARQAATSPVPGWTAQELRQAQRCLGAAHVHVGVGGGPTGGITGAPVAKPTGILTRGPWFTPLVERTLEHCGITLPRVPHHTP